MATYVGDLGKTQDDLLFENVAGKVVAVTPHNGEIEPNLSSSAQTERLRPRRAGMRVSTKASSVGQTCILAQSQA
jgi:hypothetical protein